MNNGNRPKSRGSPQLAYCEHQTRPLHAENGRRENQFQEALSRCSYACWRWIEALPGQEDWFGCQVPRSLWISRQSASSDTEEPRSTLKWLLKVSINIQGGTPPSKLSSLHDLWLIFRWHCIVSMTDPYNTKGLVGKMSELTCQPLLSTYDTWKDELITLSASSWCQLLIVSQIAR